MPGEWTEEDEKVHPALFNGELYNGVTETKSKSSLLKV